MIGFVMPMLPRGGAEDSAGELSECVVSWTDTTKAIAASQEDLL